MVAVWEMNGTSAIAGAIIAQPRPHLARLTRATVLARTNGIKLVGSATQRPVGSDAI